MKKPALVKSLQRAIELEAGIHIILSLVGRGASSPATLSDSHDRHSKPTNTTMVDTVITGFAAFILQLANSDTETV